MTEASVYIGMTVDVIHHGHINIIEQARQYGKITIGLLTDSAIAEHKRLPQLTYDQRRKIVSNISGVHHVVPQEEWNYAPNLLRYRPQFMVHGTDWQSGPLLPYRQLALDALAKYGGRLIEVPYTQGISSQKILDDKRLNGISVEARRATLKRCILAKPITRIIEAHNPISALIAEAAKNENQGKLREFDGFWSSSLTDSAAKGKPDTEALTISERLNNINDIFEVTTKPLIFDGDTGGQAQHFALNVKSMERLGISAVIIEDKKGLKRNSLLGNEVAQTQETIEEFSEKLLAGRSARVGDDLMIFARVESLILEKGMNDALTRAASYVASGADGIMIHSRKKTAAEVQEFAALFRRDFTNTPLVCVPTSYHLTTENELADSGFNVVIYANHLLRAAYPAMHQAAMEILRHGRSFEAEARLLSIDEILKLIPGTSA